jgi:hypothetical protein
MARQIAVLLGLCALAGCTAVPHEAQRQVQVKAASPEEGFDAVSETFLSRWDGMAEADRAGGTLLTTWLSADGPDRLERRRARGVVQWRGEDEGALIEVAVELETSTHKTDFGELDTASPRWVAGTADHALEAELLGEIERRLAPRARED